MKTLDRIKQEKFIGIFRHIDRCYAGDAAQAMYDGGIRIFEITFDPSSPDTIEETRQIICGIRERFGGTVSVGAGTVLNKGFAEAAFEAGAEFLVSPCTSEELIFFARQKGMVSMPGAYTATEIVRAYELGADIVKIFPIALEDIGYLKNITAPLSHIPYIPTGGVNPDTISTFMELGAAAVAAGASVVTNQLCAGGGFERIKENAARHIAAVGQYR